LHKNIEKDLTSGLVTAKPPHHRVKSVENFQRRREAIKTDYQL
jgi:hypothetical protein